VEVPQIIVQQAAMIERQNMCWLQSECGCEVAKRLLRFTFFVVSPPTPGVRIHELRFLDNLIEAGNRQIWFTGGQMRLGLHQDLGEPLCFSFDRVRTTSWDAPGQRHGQEQ
jgi:hypothetical protein